MILLDIELKNFRLHLDTNLHFSDKKNFIMGGNGQGKTTILEAIYYLCTSKNFSLYDLETLNFVNSFFQINGNFKGVTENKVKVVFSKEEGRKSYFVNNKQVNRTSEIIGKFPIVILTPSDHYITQGTPGDRRKFFDSIISQASQAYLQTLLDYNKTARQRSSLLNQIKETGNRGLLEQLDAWTEKLIITGTEIIKSRIKFLTEFQEYLKKSYSDIMNESEEPSVEYEYLDKKNDTNDIEQSFRQIINVSSEDEIRRGTNLFGPHRDEYKFKLNNIDLKKYGSQGQHKTFQVMLRFAEYFYLKEKLGNNPIFLMDDVFGELDAYRAGKISEHLENLGQTFITLTDFTNLSYLKKSESDMTIKINKGIASYA